jgi:hypothetical protein
MPAGQSSTRVLTFKITRTEALHDFSLDCGEFLEKRSWVLLDKLLTRVRPVGESSIVLFRLDDPFMRRHCSWFRRRSASLTYLLDRVPFTPPLRRSVDICVDIYLLIDGAGVRYAGNDLARFLSAFPYSVDERFPVTPNGLYIMQAMQVCLPIRKWHPGHECYASQRQSRATRLWYLCYNFFHCTLIYIHIYIHIF